MKKALALVLALVLALSMAVSAFALDVVTLKPAATTSATITNISDPKYQLGQDEDYGTKYLVGPEGGVFYVTLDGSKELKNIEVTANGIVDAKLVKYDPETMTGAKTEYVVTVDGEEVVLDPTDLKDSKALVSVLTKKDTIATAMGGATIEFVLSDAATLKAVKDAVLKDGKTLAEAVPAVFSGLAYKDVIIDAGETSYKFVKALAAALNNEYKTSRYKVSNINEENVYVIELTVAENYSAAYKTGSVKVTADEVIGETEKGRDITEAVSGTISIVSDVAVFEYEMVKWAAANSAKGAALELTDLGYSDYLTALDGYGKEYDEDELRYDAATVVSTTAFRAIAEKDLVVVANEYFEVALKEIAAGQKGVNFANYIDIEWEDDDKDEKWDNGEEDLTAIELGFLGDQIIKGEFEIAVDLGIDYYELRELFGLKVEEEDIITYYVLDENDNIVKTIKVDYMVDDIDEDVEFTIAGENKALGEYSIVLEVPAVETEGEANPNTGAESVVGVVAALAVVSVATAAAVSLKK